MKIKSINLQNFRNIKEMKLEFSDNINWFYGLNGQGKTNILEAIYITGFGKSWRTNKNQYLIKLGNNEATIRVNFKENNKDEEIYINICRFKKNIYYDNKKISKLSQIIGKLKIVKFSPEDLDIVSGSPEVRRNYFDRVISSINYKYLDLLIDYNKILVAKNKLLKELTSYNDLLDIYNQKLASLACYLNSERQNYVKILQNEHLIEIKYSNSNQLSDENSFYNKLKRDYEKEKRLGYAVFGPHTEDYKFFMEDKEIKNFASQGEQKNYSIELILSQIKIIQNYYNENPVILLDDVFSQLDQVKREKLLRNIIDYQTFITDTNEIFNCEIIEKMNKNYLVQGGKICKIY